MRSGQSGFSLMELMAVVAIVAVLFSLSVSGLAKARQASQRSACLQNLHQLCVATALFQAENQNGFPQMNWWETHLLAYMNAFSTKAFTNPETMPNLSRSSNPFYCLGTTAAERRSAVMGANNCWVDRLSYGINGSFTAPGANASSAGPVEPLIRISTFPTANADGFNPSRLLLYSDALTPNLWANTRMPANRHGNGINVVFADLHAETVTVTVGSNEWMNLFAGYNQR